MFQYVDDAPNWSSIAGPSIVIVGPLPGIHMPTMADRRIDPVSSLQFRDDGP